MRYLRSLDVKIIIIIIIVFNVIFVNYDNIINIWIVIKWILVLRRIEAIKCPNGTF